MLRAALPLLEQHGLLEHHGLLERLKPTAADSRELHNNLLARGAAFAAQSALSVRVGRCLPELLAGRRAAPTSWIPAAVMS
ncbi:hypothetical protein GCM10027612_01130 [Microbispora bryophytorum subsp. camponoti]